MEGRKGSMANIKKKDADCKNAIITVRATQEQKEKIEKKAKNNKQSLSMYMLETCLYKKHVNTINEQKRLEHLIRAQDALECLGRSLKKEYPTADTQDVFNRLKEEVKMLWQY